MLIHFALPSSNITMKLSMNKLNDLWIVQMNIPHVCLWMVNSTVHVQLDELV